MLAHTGIFQLHAGRKSGKKQKTKAQSNGMLHLGFTFRNTKKQPAASSALGLFISLSLSASFKPSSESMYTFKKEEEDA